MNSATVGQSVVQLTARIIIVFQRNFLSAVYKPGDSGQDLLNLLKGQQPVLLNMDITAPFSQQLFDLQVQATNKANKFTPYGRRTCNSVARRFWQRYEL